MVELLWMPSKKNTLQCVELLCMEPTGSRSGNQKKEHHIKQKENKKHTRICKNYDATLV